MLFVVNLWERRRVLGIRRINFLVCPRLACRSRWKCSVIQKYFLTYMKLEKYFITCTLSFGIFLISENFVVSIPILQIANVWLSKLVL